MTSSTDDTIAQLRNLQQRVADLTTRPAESGEECGQPLMYDSAGNFAEQWLLHHIERRVTTGAGDTAWCPGTTCKGRVDVDHPSSQRPTGTSDRRPRRAP